MERKTKGKNDHIYEGVIISTIGLVLMLILFGVFGKSGKAVADFFIGSFGYVMYGYAVAMFIIGILRCFRFKPNISILKLCGILLAVISGIALLHSISSFKYIDLKYGAYLKECYESADTAGGVICGVFLYPIIKLSYVFSIVLTGFLIIGFVGLAFYPEINKGFTYGVQAFRSNRENRGTIVDFKNKNKYTEDKQVGNTLYTDTLDGAGNNGKFNRSIFSKNVDYVPLEDMDNLREREFSRNFTEKDGVDTGNIVSPINQSDIAHRRENPEAGFNALFNENVSSNNTIDDQRIDEDRVKRAMDILYSDKMPKNKINQHLEGDYETYTNNYRLKKIKENLFGIQEDEDKNTDREIDFDLRLNSDNSVNRDFREKNYVDENKKQNIVDEYFEINDIKVEKAEESNNTDNGGLRNQTERLSDLSPEVEDLSAKNNEPLEKFQDLLRKKQELREFEEQQRKLKEHLGDNYADEIIEQRKERSDKGGLHQFGTGVNFGLMKNSVPDITPPKTEPKEIMPKIKPKIGPYKYPPIELLRDYNSSPSENEDFTDKIDILENTLSTFNINAKVKNIVTGPTFTRLELQMPPGISVNRIANFSNDIAMCLEAKSVRCQIPIPGKNAFGVEIPNKSRGTVGLKRIISSPEFNNNKQNLSFVVGMDCDGRNYVADLTKMPHMLIAGATGAGKSVCINSLIISILYKYSPQQVRLLLVDPKQVELNMYNGLPHLLIPEAVCDKERALNLLDWAIEEMESRYSLFSGRRVKNINEFNETVDTKTEEKIPYIVIIFDEVGDFMVSIKKELEDRIVRITQKARAAGIILILATQRPSVDVITGVIKANLPARMAFAVASFQDSKTILDHGGAEKLLRDGDMLFLESTSPEPVRVQGAFISGGEVDAVCEYIRANNDCYFDSDIQEVINATKESKQANGAQTGFSNGTNAMENDKLFIRALMYVVECGVVSISKLQRKFALGFPKAARIVDTMEELGYVGPQKENKTREVLIDRETLLNRYGDAEIE